MMTEEKMELDNRLDSNQQECIHGDEIGENRRFLSAMPKPIHILTRRRMAYITLEVPYAVISIATPGDEEAEIAPSDKCVSILRLSFNDIRASQCHPEWLSFVPEHARSIWAFVAEHWENIEALIIHCDAGQSRSPGVAAALDKVLNGDDSRWWKGYRFNYLVYETLLNEAS